MSSIHEAINLKQGKYFLNLGLLYSKFDFFFSIELIDNELGKKYYEVEDAFKELQRKYASLGS